MLQDITNLLKSTIENFDIDADVQLLSQINKKITKLQSSRYEKLGYQESELQQLTTQYEHKLSEIKALEVSLDRKRILKEFNELNNLKFKLAKSYQELENEINELNLVFKKKSQELVELKNLNLLNLEINNNPSSNVLKLKVYKNLGLLVEMEKQFQKNSSRADRRKSLANSTANDSYFDDDNDEEMTPMHSTTADDNDNSFLDKVSEETKKYKLIITNNRTNMITTLNIDEGDNKLSDYFISNYIWENL